MKMKTMLALAALTTGISTVTLADDDNVRSISTGIDGGTYHSVGERFSDHLRRSSDGNIALEVVTSTGASENVKRFNDNNGVDAIVIQQDTPDKIKRRHTNYPLYDEVVMWVINPKHNIKDLEDIEGDTEYRIVMVEGSGPYGTFTNFVSEDSGYQVNMDKTIWVDSSMSAFKAVADGVYVDGSDTFKIAGTIYVGGKIPDSVVELFGDQLKIGSATDKDFNDSPYYKDCEVTEKNANGIKTVGWGDPDTVCVTSMLTIADDIKHTDKDAFIAAALRTQRDMKSRQ